MKNFFLLVVLSLSAIYGKYALAQNLSCEDVLVRVRESFDSGHLYGIPAQLKKCLDNGFNKTQRIQAYRILTRTYLLIDDPISAEDSYLKLLKLDPEYKFDEENDPVDLVYLSRKFTTTPIFVLFAKGGFSVSQISVIHNFGTDNTATTLEEYESGGGGHIGGGVELNINKNFGLGVELLLRYQGYRYKNVFFNGDAQTLKENQYALAIPVYLKYRIEYHKWRPYIYAGFAPKYLLSAEASVELIDRVESGEGSLSEFSVTGPSISMNDVRSGINYSGFVGIGTNYRVGYRYIFIDLRYTRGLTNIVDKSKQYANDELLYKYAYVDDYKRLNDFSISIGYVWPLYKPRKIYRKKNFINRIFKK